MWLERISHIHLSVELYLKWSRGTHQNSSLRNQHPDGYLQGFCNPRSSQGPNGYRLGSPQPTLIDSSLELLFPAPDQVPPEVEQTRTLKRSQHLSIKDSSIPKPDYWQQQIIGCHTPHIFLLRDENVHNYGWFGNLLIKGIDQTEIFWLEKIGPQLSFCRTISKMIGEPPANAVWRHSSLEVLLKLPAWGASILRGTSRGSAAQDLHKVPKNFHQEPPSQHILTLHLRYPSNFQPEEPELVRVP